MDDPKVSVWMITYNHERFVAQAIESVLMQTADFPVELVIGEDGSTDGTRAICAEYARAHPSRVRLLPGGRNLGVVANMVRTLAACRGPYIALCEGDDYWTDPNKLQKQVAWLDGHPAASFCFHPCRIESAGPADSAKSADGVHRLTGAGSREVFEDSRALVMWCVVPTVSAMARKSMLPDFGNEWKTAPVGDWPLFFHLGMRGPFGCLKETMAVYRLHGGSAWSSRDVETQRKTALDAYRFIRKLGEETYPDEFRKADVNQLRDYVDDLCLLGESGKSMQSVLADGIERIASPFHAPRVLSFFALQALFYKALHARRLADARRVLKSLVWRHPSILLDRHWVRYVLKR